MRLPLWGRQQREEELEAEIQSHLAMAMQDRMERGETAEKARASARREFGNVSLVKEVTRDMWGWTSLDRLGQDLRFGLRMLLKNPGFTLIAIITLSLGIGANTAIFSVVNAVLLRPLPFHRPEQLVSIYGNFRQQNVLQGRISVAEFADYRDRGRVFEQIAAYRNQAFTLTGAGKAELIRGAVASASLLSLLGVRPLRGRDFLPEEVKPGNNQVVVLSFGL